MIILTRQEKATLLAMPHYTPYLAWGWSVNGCYGAWVEGVDDFAENNPIHYPLPKVV